MIVRRRTHAASRSAGSTLTNNSTKVVSLHLYQTAFSDGRFGEASAMGVIMALVTMVVAVVVITLIRPKKADR